jgi:hypothetical protein
MPSLILFVYLTAAGQTPGGQGQVASEFSLQKGRIADACAAGAASLYKCPIEFLTDHPIHMAVGSLAPQNGFAFGPAYVTHFYNSQRDISINADAVGTSSGNWRAGLYFKLVLTPVPETVVVPIGPSGPPAENGINIHPYPIIDAYVQTTSLHTIFFFGLGPDSLEANRTSFSMRETVTGGRVVYPLFTKGKAGALNLAASGEVNGRFVDVQSSDPRATPYSTTLNEITAPGLTSQPGFLQLGEGIRIKPAALNGRLRFNYFAKAEQFVAASSGSSFRRWTGDLDHEFSFYRTMLPAASRDTHGPNDCSATLGDSPCPPPSPSRNRYGSVGFRLYASTSTVSSGDAVPFYFQQTLGGSDIDGTRWLSAYQDYRFRGPGVFALRETLEHYIYGIVGLSVVGEQGTVSAPGEGLKFSGLKHSVSAGASLRVGGLPVAYIMYGWGPEGNRLIAVVNTSLLGGSSRPSLQ